MVLISVAYFLSPSVQATAKQKELPPSIQKIVKLTIDSYLGKKDGVDPSFLKTAEKEVINQINSLLSPYYKFMPPIFAFGLFLVLQGFSFLLIWLASITSVFLFWIFKKAGIIGIEKIQKEAEILIF